MGLCSEPPNATMPRSRSGPPLGRMRRSAFGTAGGAGPYAPTFLCESYARRGYELRVTRRQLLGSVGVLGMAALAAGSAKVLDEWIGDLGAMLWIAGAFFIPYLTGIALRQRGAGNQGRMIGALVGAATVVLPTVGYALVIQPDLAEIQMPLLWSLFTPLSLAQGAIAMPVGATVRRSTPPLGQVRRQE
jgi:hypothetical protein